MHATPSMKSGRGYSAGMLLVLASFSGCTREAVDPQPVVTVTPTTSRPAASPAPVDVPTRSTPSQERDRSAELGSAVERVAQLRKSMELEWTRITGRLEKIQVFASQSVPEPGLSSGRILPPLKPLLLREEAFADLPKAHQTGDLHARLLSQADLESTESPEQRSILALDKLYRISQDDMVELRTRLQVYGEILPIVEACAVRAENEARLRAQGNSALLEDKRELLALKQLLEGARHLTDFYMDYQKKAGGSPLHRCSFAAAIQQLLATGSGAGLLEELRKNPALDKSREEALRAIQAIKVDLIKVIPPQR